MKRRVFSAFVFATTVFANGPAFALKPPSERPVLTVSGKIGLTNVGKLARFDMKMLEALPQHSFTTRTPWYDKPVKFTGPLLADVLAAVQASGSTLSAVAINDYQISIPMADTTRHKVIVARLLDDQPMPVREKGPLFIVYPFDESAELRASTYYERSIWQLKALEVR
jgi:hypothetical protein